MTIVSVAVFAIGAAWGLSTPMGAGPDEQNHMITAYSVVHGHIGQQEVTVPAYLDFTMCFAHQADVTADCAEPLSQSLKPVHLTSQFGSYFPAYYAFVGLPTLVLHGTPALYGMRLMNALLFGVLIGAAFVLVSRPATTLIRVGLVCSLPPMALFLAGVVNGSSFEIAAAVFTWVAALRAFPQTDQPRSLQRRDLLILLIGIVLMLSSRLLAPLWVAIILTAVLTMNAAWRDLISLLKTRFGLIWVGGIAAWAGVTLVWARVHPVTYIGVKASPASLNEALSIFVNTMVNEPYSLLISATGDLGWLDTPLHWSPILILAAWGVLLGMAASAFTKHRQPLVLLGLILLSFVLPVALETIFWGGIGWQGRYTLPMMVGIPLLAASQFGYGRVAGSTVTQNSSTYVWGLGAAMALVWTAAVNGFMLNYQRYSAGFNVTFPAISKWESPIGFWAPALVAALGFLLLSWLAVGLRSRDVADRVAEEPETLLGEE
jgi:hypothetical protein